MERRKKRRGVAGGGMWNLDCGARFAQLWVDEGDVETRAQVKRLVQGVLERGRRVSNRCRGRGEQLKRM
jgi:hypothetical protein